MDETRRELAYRAGDGIEVRLVWRVADDQLTVAVADARTGERFMIDVTPPEALDVFEHPFAYASWLGLELATAV
jgi:hypothetical protein